MKAERDYGDKFFWVLGGIPKGDSTETFVYYIVPSKVMAENVSSTHKKWLRIRGKKGQKHRDNKLRVVVMKQGDRYHWDLSTFKNRWDLIIKKLT
jgi:hypothetical protein